MKLTKDQTVAVKKAIDFTSSNGKLFTLGGFAGTGKTTIVGRIRHKLKNKRVAFCCFTGKATKVLREKLKAIDAVYDGDSVSTVHKLMYEPVFNSKREIVDWERKAFLEYDLIIIDEASMINERLFEDLYSYFIPIIAVGDHGQLPPVGGALNLMESPDVKLEKIHRQKDGNPILGLSADIRKNGIVKEGSYGDKCTKIVQSSSVPLTDFLKKHIDKKTINDSVVLVGTNVKRINVNRAIRFQLGYYGIPNVGERIICLKNDYKHNIFNGETGVIKKIVQLKNGKYKMKIAMDDSDGRVLNIPVLPYFFNNKDGIGDVKLKSACAFDYAYAVTVHKSQGSQYKKVLVLESTYYGDDRDFKRWLYTAVTRSSDELYIYEEL